MSNRQSQKARRTAPQPDLTGVALRGFFGIAAAWGLNTAQQRKLLGDPPSSTFFKWKRNLTGTLTKDVLERISYVLGIYKGLQILIPDPERADQWISRPNAASIFGGQSALDRMLGGNVGDLYTVRQYLDAQRG